MRKKLLLTFGGSAIAVPVMSLIMLIMSRPERFSTQFLKTGGRLIKQAVDNAGGVAVGLSVSVVLLWGIIMLACWVQSEKQESVPPQ